MLNKAFSGKSITILSLLVFLFYFMYRIMLVFYPHPDIGGVEGNVAYFIQRILDGQPVYTDPELPPYSIAQYSPLYYYLVAAIAKLFQVKADDVFSVFITGRVVSLILNLGFSAIVFSICRKIFAVSVLRSIVVGVLSFVFLQITSFGRPDSLYHFFFMAALYFFLKTVKENTGAKTAKNIVIGAVLSVLTIFSKQTGIVLPFIFLFWFLYKKEYKHFFLFGMVYLAAIGLFLFGINYYIGLSLFSKNVVLGINNGISLGWYRNVILSFYYGFGLLFLLAMGIILFMIRKDRRDLLKLSGIILLLLFIFLNVIALKMGSVQGYLTEWWTFLFILAAYYWPVLVKTIPALNHKLLFILSAVILLLKLYQVIDPLKEKTRVAFSSSRLAGYNNEKQVAELVKSKLLPGEKFMVFTNLYTPESYISNFLFRQAVVPQFEIIALSTYPRKKYDYAGLDTGLKTGQFKWMLMKQKDIQKLFFNIRLENYQLADTLHGFNLYQYKP